MVFKNTSLLDTEFKVQIYKAILIMPNKKLISQCGMMQSWILIIITSADITTQILYFR